MYFNWDTHVHLILNSVQILFNYSSFDLAKYHVPNLHVILLRNDNVNEQKISNIELYMQPYGLIVVRQINYDFIMNFTVVEYQVLPTNSSAYPGEALLGCHIPHVLLVEVTRHIY